MKLLNFLRSFFKTDAEFPEHSVHRIELKTLEGVGLPLSQFKGKKLLIVNVASECGLTPQYEQLQQLYDKYNDRLEILGVPCNDFAGQEPGVAEQIRAFCTTKYDVTFTLSEKINVKTNPIHPLYDFLTRKDQNNYLDSIVEWNFQKYLLNETGELIAVFPPPVSPTSEEVISML